MGESRPEREGGVERERERHSTLLSLQHPPWEQYRAPHLLLRVPAGRSSTSTMWSVCSGPASISSLLSTASLLPCPSLLPAILSKYQEATAPSTNPEA